MIFVFKTNVDSISKVKKVTPKLNQLFPNSKWNFDLEDCDNILRVDSELNVAELLQNNAIFDCIELD